MASSSTADPATPEAPAPVEGIVWRPVAHANVHEAVVAIIHDLPAIAKDSEIKEGANYKYRGIEAIKATLKANMANHGVHYAPVAVRDVVDSKYPVGSAGKEWERIRQIVVYRVWGPAGAEDYFDVEVRGEGADNSDKAANKVMTVAEKQFLIQAFCIADADGDDPDATRAPERDSGSSSGGHSAPPPPATNPPLSLAQAKGSIFVACGKDREAATDWWVENVGIDVEMMFDANQVMVWETAAKDWFASRQAQPFETNPTAPAGPQIDYDEEPF